VLVDRHDYARALHTDLVLDCARNAAGDVELRRDGLAGLADLRCVGIPPGVDDRARRSDRPAERLGELFDEREVLGSTEPAPAGDDHGRVFDGGPFALLVRLVDHTRRRGEIFEGHIELYDLRGTAGRAWIERPRPEE